MESGRLGAAAGDGEEDVGGISKGGGKDHELERLHGALGHFWDGQLLGAGLVDLVLVLSEMLRDRDLRFDGLAIDAFADERAPEADDVVGSASGGGGAFFGQLRVAVIEEVGEERAEEGDDDGDGPVPPHLVAVDELKAG